MILSHVAQVRAALVFREQTPQEGPHGNVRALAIRDLVSSKPLSWSDLPRATIPDRHLEHCLRSGDVVLPSRGDHYKAWFFGGAEEPVFPVGQLNVITPGPGLDGRYLAWYLNQSSTQTRLRLILTGTSIKALTKAALLTLDIDVPALSKQYRIAELDHTSERIVSIRHRLNELDSIETAFLTGQLLKAKAEHA